MDTLLQGEVDNMLIYAFLLSKFESWDEAINHLEQHKESDFLNAGMDIYYFLSQLIDWGELDAARRIFDFKNIRRYCHYSDSIRDKLL